MNTEWLDSLARSVGTATTRRGAVRFLAGALPGGLFALGVARDASAGCVRPGKKYRKGKTCCPGTKRKKGRCKCRAGTVACGKVCCPSGQSCLPTLSGGKICDITDQVPGQVCDPNVPTSCASDICGCGPGGCTCREATCAGAGEPCATNSDCCESLCFALEGYICGPLP